MNSTTYYLYGLNQISQGDTSSTSRQYNITDGMGNVRYLTNSSGTTAASFTNDAYGQQTYGGSATNYVYQTEQKDQESNLIFLRARYYDPMTSRFTSKDPMPGDPMIAGSQNGYNYANNNPVNLSDPNGEMPTMLVGAIFGAAVGMVTSGITYAVTTENFSWRDLGASVAGGTVGGAITGACLGMGVAGIGGSSLCGAAAGLAGDFITQSLDSRPGMKVSELGVASVAGGISGALGEVTSAKINRGWLELANRNPGGLSSRNLLPWATTGSLGQRMQYNTLVGGLWDFGLGIDSEAVNATLCNWGGLKK